MRPRLAIFDSDGVLVNTEPLYFAMNREFIRAHGGDFDFSYYEHIIGLSGELIWTELKAAFALPQAAGMYGIGYVNPGSGKQDLSVMQLIIHSFTDQKLIDLCS